MRSLLAAFLVLTGACTLDEARGTETTTLAQDEVTIPPSTTGSTTTLVTTTSAAITTMPSVEGPAKALVTPTGVVVAVLDETPAGFVVSSPCGNETFVSTGTPISSADVVIDPGHGGDVDTGAHGANGLIERDLNLAVSQAVEAKLIVRGIPVLLTRTANYASTLSVRAALADAVDAGLLLSVHHNAPTPEPSSRPGTEVFVQHDSSDSRRLGGLVWRSVVQALSRFDVDWVAASDAGVLSVLSTRGEDAYGINRNTDTVSVLAELGYISNPAEAELFASNAYVEAAAEALADAIEDYLNTEEPGSGFVAEPRVFNPQPGIGARVCEDPELE